jgi:hypothetical protein
MFGDMNINNNNNISNSNNMFGNAQNQSSMFSGMNTKQKQVN